MRVIVERISRSRDADKFRSVWTEVLGPTLTLESALPDAEQRMNGSLLIAQATSIEEVRGIVESDVYYNGNIVSLLKHRD